MSWISLPKAETGNPIGIGSNYTLSGSGELDNGWSVALSIAATNKMAYSTTNVTVTVPSLGDLIVTQGGTGKGIDRMDDVTPNVWEEAYGTGLTTGIQTVNGATTGAGIEWTPNMMPDGLTARIFYSPDVTGAPAADKGASGSAINSGSSGYDVTLVADESITGMAGLTIGGGYSEFDRTSASGDASDMTVYATYAIGGFTVGYQWSEADLGTTTGATQYDNDGYGITFAVNDDLSIGYNHYESTQNNTANVTAEATSMQIAYSMGGASVRLASSDGENMAYQTGVDYDRDSTVLSVSLAF
jgi:outer membrane protein OmpU